MHIVEAKSISTCENNAPAQGIPWSYSNINNLELNSELDRFIEIWS